MSKLTPIEKQSRADFILNRLKRGFSFKEVQKQFCKAYGVHAETARLWANWACDQIAQEESPQTRKRNFNVIVEMFHDQIVSSQNDLIAMQKEIDSLGTIIDRRNALIVSLADPLQKLGQQERRDLIDELKSLPEVSLSLRPGLIESKSRLRERMYHIMNDLARLRGFTGIQSDWRQALNTLLDNNLIPPAIADGILSVIDDFEGNIRAIEVQVTEDIEIPNLDDDLDIRAEYDLEAEL
jgi:hypothetical protein